MAETIERMAKGDCFDLDEVIKLIENLDPYGRYPSLRVGMIDFLKKIFLKFERRMKSRFEWSKGSIALNEMGFIVDFRGRRSSVRWRDVTRINAFKKDLFSIDLICMEFHQDGVASVVEIEEQMEGYANVEKILPDEFIGIDKDWWSKVAKPAFVTNFTEIWKRP